MSELVGRHVERIRAQLATAGLTQARQWIENNTWISGDLWSFIDHEFQMRVADEMAREVNVRKCSQIGLSELSVRLALAYCNLVPGFTVIYTLPTAAFASTFTQTRVDPVVATSPSLVDALDKNVNSSQIKQFGTSFLYIKGTVGAGAAISVPSDCNVHDEYDFSDLQVTSNYESRLTHSKYKLKRKFSTPTVGGYGISGEFASSKRYWLLVKCSCCQHSFVPDYYTHVRLPNFKGDTLKEITKRNAHKFDLNTAYVECPKCAGKPDLGIQHREWVCENPDSGFTAVGIQIQPFDAPRIITPGDLIRASTGYSRTADFINFNLGLPAEDAESSFSAEEIRNLFVEHPTWGFNTHVMGIDLGVECHIMIGGITPEGDIRIVKTEIVPVRELAQRKMELALRYRVVSTVCDLFPYSETVWRMQQKDMNMWAAIFSQKKTVQAYDLRHIEADRESAQPEIREVQINRNRAFDSLMAQIRQPGGVLIANEGEERKDEIVAQMTDMKRIKDVFSVRDESGTEQFRWEKSTKKNDHFHHTLLYVWLAAQLRGTGGAHLPMSLILGKVRHRV